MAHSSMSHSESTSGSMAMAFTTSLGQSTLWITAFAPRTVGGTVGACIGLFALSVFSRYLTVLGKLLENGLEHSLEIEKQAVKAFRLATDSAANTTALPQSNTLSSRRKDNPENASFAIKKSPPLALATLFSPAIITAAFVTFQQFITYLLMLAVMTFNVYFFVSILVGVLIGEMFFGRFGVCIGSNVRSRIRSDHSSTNDH